MKKTLRNALLAVAILTLATSQALAGARFSRLTVWGSGQILTAQTLNSEFDNLLANLTPAGVDGDSSTLPAMRATANPYPAGTESQAASLEGEIQQLRYQLNAIIGQTYWYQSPSVSLIAIAPVGAVMEYELATAPTGWLFLDGTTIGDGSSGATARANADQATLFAGLWAAQDNTKLIIQDSSGNPTTRGANATADFAAHKRLPLPNRRGRVAIGAGQGNTAEGGGAGTNRVLGTSGGAETHTQATGELALHNHTVAAINSSPGGSTTVVVSAQGETGGEALATTNTGSSTPMAIMNPFRVTNYIIKY